MFMVGGNLSASLKKVKVFLRREVRSLFDGSCKYSF